MLFTSTIFLFLFLPTVLFFYFLLPKQYKNLLLMAASLFFYAWGEVLYVAIMVISIAVNYSLAICTDKAKVQSHRKFYLALAVSVNLGILGWFKYANFMVGNFNHVLTGLHLPEIQMGSVHLPIGISFFTFQALSYVIDVYRGKVQAQKRFVDIALYISLFPQLIAGPIVRYADIARQISARRTRLDDFAEGVRRFVLGMGKKMLIANPMAEVADRVMLLPADELTLSVSWLGIACYSLQIYFDFSGYSDMAIGLGRMFGFTFLENFRYPYISRSIREFWQRWHISLSSWFRDFLYIPLGGNKCSAGRNYLNLWIVFLLCGLWHGASWNFLIWGCWHGLFLVLERIGLGAILKRLWQPIRHMYLLLIVMIGWTFFRIEDLPHGIEYLKTMFGLGNAVTSAPPLIFYFSFEHQLIFIIGVIGSMPLYQMLQSLNQKMAAHKRFDRLNAPYGWLRAGMETTKVILLAGVFFLSIMYIAAGTYNPFIYFRF
jgi:alginate O-acetyltransferase complex protein AlgI